MPFCTNCGHQVADGVKFCSECGTPINPTQNQRKQVFAGDIQKCPNCGELLPSFTANCPSCGYEIRGVEANDSIREFSLNLAHTESDTQKISLIQSFPIPNTKEDVLEFIILATTNFNADQSLLDNGIKKDISDAWFSKIEQSYQKAKLLFAGDKDFSKIQNVYDQACNQIKSSKQKAKIGTIADIALRTIGLWGGLITFIIAFILDIVSHTNTSVLHLGGGAIMIVGALMIGRKTRELFDVGVGVVCTLLAMLFGILLEEVFHENGSAMMLAGGLALIIVIVRLVKSSIKK